MLPPSSSLISLSQLLYLDNLFISFCFSPCSSCYYIRRDLISSIADCLLESHPFMLGCYLFGPIPPKHVSRPLLHCLRFGSRCLVIPIVRSSGFFYPIPSLPIWLCPDEDIEHHRIPSGCRTIVPANRVAIGWELLEYSGTLDPLFLRT